MRGVPRLQSEICPLLHLVGGVSMEHRVHRQGPELAIGPCAHVITQHGAQIVGRSQKGREPRRYSRTPWYPAWFIVSKTLLIASWYMRLFSSAPSTCGSSATRILASVLSRRCSRRQPRPMYNAQNVCREPPNCDASDAASYKSVNWPRGKYAQATKFTTELQ